MTQLTTYYSWKDLSKNEEVIQNEWDLYFYKIASAAASKSRCHSRQIGAVIIKDHSVISTGYNGPPRGVPHCKTEDGRPECPRHEQGFARGEGLHICPAVHAEANVIVNAARLGICTNGCTMYLTCEFPCKWCMGMIINAGISEVVVTSEKVYDEMALCMQIFGKKEIIVRRYI